MSAVLLSNLPIGCMDADIHRALLMYGTAVNIVMNAATSQAVVTMRTPQEAQALLSRRAVNVVGTSVRVDPHIDGRQQPQQLAPPPQPQQQHQQHQQQMNSVSYGYGGASVPLNSGGGSAPNNYQASLPMGVTQPPSNYSGHAIMPAPQQTSNRLRVVVEDCRYPITRDVLLQMFSMISPPVQVYCGQSGPTTTGEVEFAEASSAERAMQQFNNNAIYPGCCYVRLFYEPPRQSHQTPSHQAPPPLPMAQPQQQPPPPQQQQPPYGGGRGGDMYTMQQSQSAGEYDHMSRDPLATYPPPHSAADLYSGGSYMGPGMRGGRGGRGAMIRGGRGVARGMGRGMGPVTFQPYEAHPPGGFTGRGDTGSNDTTLIVGNVPLTVPLYDLWVLLEVFGNILSLKRQFTDKTNVVAQFQNPLDARNAVIYLQSCPFRGAKLRLKRFAGFVDRGSGVEWNAGPSTDPATLAVLFTSGYHHRTKPSAPANLQGRVSPEKNLYVSNLAESITDDAVKEKLRGFGFNVIEFDRKSPTVAILSFQDTETAVDALIALHGKEMNERFLRVTFSRYPPGSRAAVPKMENEEGKAQHAEEEGAVQTTTAPTLSPSEAVEAGNVGY